MTKLCGSMPIDLLGGILPGEIALFYGPTETYKTAIGTGYCNCADRRGEAALYVTLYGDAVSRLRPGVGVSWAATMNRALEVILRAVDGFDVIVLDALGAEQPFGYSQLSPDDKKGALNRLLATVLPLLGGHHAALILLAEVREALGREYGVLTSPVGELPIERYADRQFSLRRTEARVITIDTWRPRPILGVAAMVNWGKLCTESDVLYFGLQSGLVERVSRAYWWDKQVALGNNKPEVIDYLTHNPDACWDMYQKILEVSHDREFDTGECQ